MNDRLHVDNLILGAGLSGISFAYFLNSDNYLILEKDSTPGGYCRTIKNPNYVWDYAGHFYHFKTEKYKKLFESLVEPEQIIHQVKNTKIYFKGRKIDYPFQMNIHQLPQDDFISCLYDLFTKDENIDINEVLRNKEMLNDKIDSALAKVKEYIGFVMLSKYSDFFGIFFSCKNKYKFSNSSKSSLTASLSIIITPSFIS